MRCASINFVSRRRDQLVVVDAGDPRQVTRRDAVVDLPDPLLGESQQILLCVKRAAGGDPRPVDPRGDADEIQKLGLDRGFDSLAGQRGLEQVRPPLVDGTVFQQRQAGPHRELASFVRLTLLEPRLNRTAAERIAPVEIAALKHRLHHADTVAIVFVVAFGHLQGERLEPRIELTPRRQLLAIGNPTLEHGLA